MPLDTGRLVFPALLVGVMLAAVPAQRGRSLEDRTAALEAGVAELRATQETVLNRLDQMRLDLDNTLDPLRVRLADQGESLRGVDARLIALEEQLALTNETLVRLSEQLAAGGGRTGQLGPSTAPMPAPPRTLGDRGPTVTATTETPEPAPLSESEALYSTAYTDYLAADYSLAISGFRQYLDLYPDSERADNAQYWIADCQFSLGDYASARRSFLEIPGRYPDGEMVPDSLYKAARSLVELGGVEEAAEEYARLIEAHPRSNAAILACGRLEALGFERPARCPR